MKTAVSIPDSLYDEAERLAKGLRISRSKLYARALARFIEENDARSVTSALDSVYREEQGSDEFAQLAAARILKNEDW